MIAIGSHYTALVVGPFLEVWKLELDVTSARSMAFVVGPQASIFTKRAQVAVHQLGTFGR
jgi:hypothetical protein